MKTSIYVCTHKPTVLPSDNPVFVPLQVGAAKNPHFGITTDDTGDNISHKNCFYGELTGYYWVWKNVHDADIVGICHYRRFFTNPDHTFMLSPDFEAALGDCDMLLSSVTCSEQPYREVFGEAHSLKYLEQTGEVIKELYPDDFPFFLESLESKSGHFGNLCVMRKPLFDEYCSWLFSIFGRLEQIVDLNGLDDYHRRLYGFISENLISVFAAARSLKTKPCRIGFTEEKAETRELKLALAQLVRLGQFSEARDLFYQVSKVRPDVRLPHSDILGEFYDMELILYILETENAHGTHGLYEVSHELGELVAYVRTARTYVRKQAAGQPLSEEETNIKSSYPLSDIAHEIISIN